MINAGLVAFRSPLLNAATRTIFKFIAFNTAIGILKPACAACGSLFSGILFISAMASEDIATPFFFAAAR